ncbi:MAG: acetyl-CoA C-acetyltransferase [Deltaproteobacteria bacterium]|nr:acetyl-CoA C-acetyltransferase [Deltaproteobacteria bacterium]
MARDVYIYDAVRTPRGKGRPGKGALSSVHPQELVAQLLQALQRRGVSDPSAVDDVILGCVSQVGEQGACIARNAVLAAGWPDAVTGSTVNRFCGSGLQAVNFAAMGVASGFQQAVLAGGVESMSRVPMGSDKGEIDGLNPALRAKIQMVPQGISADLIATREGFSRADVDAFALASQQRARLATEEGRFLRSLIDVVDAEGNCLLDRDEHPRADTTAESLAGLRPAFAGMGAYFVAEAGATVDALALRRYPDTGAIDHVHTAGNSSGIVDGAALVLLADASFGERFGLRPRARIRAMATAGAEPVIMLTAPAPASSKALAQASMTAADVDRWEINEAFATVPLETMRRLDLDHDKVNVNGGAIALGHPLGATGAILLGTLLDELEREGLGVGVATLCIGGGMGIATVIERV